MPITARPDVLAFFDRYQQAADDADPEVLRTCFAETFLNLDPRTAGPVPREALIRALAGRAQLFGGIGVAALELTELTERPLDEMHTLVSTTWSARFRADVANPEPLVLPSQFLLRRSGNSWQIVVHLNSTDLSAVVAERGGAAVGSAPAVQNPGEIAGPSPAAAPNDQS